MPLTNAQLNAISRSLRGYTGDVSRTIISDLVKGIKTAVESLIKPGVRAGSGELGVSGTGVPPVETGLNPATARNAVQDVLKKYSAQELMDSDKIDFSLSVARDVANGAGTYVKEAADADVVEAYPGWELLRVYDRDVPRGFRRGPKGVLIPIPGDDWPTRFEAAARNVGDTDALQVLEETGRMIALKSSPLWEALGEGAGGYTDTLGNPFPPFAFNSGYDVNNVSRAECIQLGLMQPGQSAPVADVDLNNLFAPIERAA